MTRYRRLGADPPFADPRRGHGVAMEGYYWRFSDPGSGRVLIALCGVCRDANGPWGAVAMAAHPGGLVGEAIVAPAAADAAGYGVHAGELLSGDDRHLSVDLGGDMRLEADLDRHVPWPRRAFGALGPAHWIPGLGQYWHPHLLDGRATGEARIGTERLTLDGWHVHAEKNWGGAFPRRWWWGQAHGFEREDVCVAFAGGELARVPLGVTASAIVVRIGDRVIRLAPPSAHVRARAGGSEWSLDGRGPRHSVAIKATASGEPYLLPVPHPAERRTERRAAQHLGGRLHVEVRRGRRILFEGESSLAGLEYGEAPRVSGPHADSA